MLPHDQREVWVDVGYWTIFCVSGGWWGIICSGQALFLVSVSYFGWLGVDGALFWLGGGEWGIILGGWGWVGKYFW